MKKIVFLLIVFTITLFANRFYKNGDYVVDKETKMMWQDTKDNITILKSQAEAIEYCENLTLGGYTDWFLPNRDEFKNIIDMKRKSEEMTIIRRFEYVLADDYWTRDKTWRNFGLWAYYIYFKSGTFYYENKTYLKYVRCARYMK